jgi:hypothetical protein
MPDEQDRSEALDDDKLTDEYPPHEAFSLDSQADAPPAAAQPDDDGDVRLVEDGDGDDLTADLAEPDTTGPLDPDADRAPAAAEEAAVHVVDTEAQ